ncbi:hypothetical protein NEHOM01_2073 [Nematocida homosporus]|uniref:uncharacterized protein n=1 Tax=Nematocida homosporus TaxID=1912981 RepID=UPI00221F2956|nr:uncharacterized protein NEHOM01_2073 [Nematocida homosporus]KAI5187295.1 hypothetical protein NEHOM01_2073 [Nematocida homosporus]
MQEQTMPRSNAYLSATISESESGLVELGTMPPEGQVVGELAVGSVISVMISGQKEEIAEIFRCCPNRECSVHSPVGHRLALYSNALFCLTHHNPGVSVSGFKAICAFERSILALVAKKDKIPLHFTNFDLYCEQEIESLSLAVFNHLMKRNASVALDEEVFAEILDLLYLRKEFERFFIVYNLKGKHTLKTFKLALLASLHKQGRTPQWVFGRLLEYLRLEPAATLPIGGEQLPDIATIEETRDAAGLPAKTRLEIYAGMRAWFNREYKEHHWQVSMRTWQESRKTEGSSEAMLSLCMKLRKYDEGWQIYRESIADGLSDLRMVRLSARVIHLMICAVNARAVDNWTERIVEVCSVVSRLDIDEMERIQNTFSILLHLERYDNISYIASQVIRQYPEKLMNSTTYCLIIKNTIQVTTQYQKEMLQEINRGQTPDIIKGAIFLYEVWKRSSARGVFSTLFVGRSAACIEAYAMTLKLAVLLRSKQTVYKVCLDIWNSGVSLSQSMVETLGNLHQEQGCNCTTYGSETAIYSRGYLTHVLSLLTPNQ